MLTVRDRSRIIQPVRKGLVGANQQALIENQTRLLTLDFGKNIVSQSPKKGKAHNERTTAESISNRGEK